MEKIRFYPLVLAIAFFGCTLFGSTVVNAKTSDIGSMFASKIDTRFYERDGSQVEPSVSLLIPLFKLIERLFDSVFKFIGDVFSGLFELMGILFKGIWDGLGWIFEQLDRFIEYIAHFIAILFSSSDDTIKKIIDAPDSDFSILRKSSTNELEKNLQKQAQLENDTKLELFVSIPTGEANYSNIFLNEAPSLAALEEIQQVRQKFSKFSEDFHGIITRSTEGSSVKDFEAVLTNSRSKYIAVVGHNDEKGFRFLHGDPISLGKLGAICVELEKTCIFLSCKSAESVNESNNSIGLKYDLSYKDAFEILYKLSSVFSHLNHISTDELQVKLKELVRTTELSVKIKPKIRILVIVTPTGYGLAGIIVGLEQE